MKKSTFDFSVSNKTAAAGRSLNLQVASGAT
jgi:hypothetical protein